MRFVEIKWLDSYTIPVDEWKKAEEIDAMISPVVCTTVGMLYKVTKDAVVIINSISDSGNYWGIVVITKSAIISAREIK